MCLLYQWTDSSLYEAAVIAGVIQPSLINSSKWDLHRNYLVQSSQSEWLTCAVYCSAQTHRININKNSDEFSYWKLCSYYERPLIDPPLSTPPRIVIWFSFPYWTASLLDDKLVQVSKAKMLWYSERLLQMFRDIEEY